MNDHGGVRLTEEVVLNEGGWNRRYARVLLIEEHDDRAVALVDGNGDGAELEIENWSRENFGKWVGGSSSGYSDLGSLERADVWSTGSYVIALGKVGPGEIVRLSYAGRTYSRAASELGIWGFMAPVNPQSPDELPYIRS